MVGNGTTSNACVCTITDFMCHGKRRGSGDNEKVGNEPITKI
jgi:hypothetical protein